jgi:hypothetical protein
MNASNSLQVGKPGASLVLYPFQIRELMKKQRTERAIFIEGFIGHAMVIH